MKTYLINMESAVARRKHMHFQFKKYHVAHEWVRATNGRALTEEQLADIANLEAIAAQPLKLSRGAIGCALSQKEVYDRMVRDNVEVALVLEDDMMFTKDVVPILQKIEREIRPGEIILLYYFSTEGAKPEFSTVEEIAPLYEHYQLMYPANEVRSAAAYVLTRETARRLSEAILPVQVEADDWMAFLRAGIIESMRCVVPKPFMCSLAETQIQLHQAAEDQQIKRRQPIKSRIGDVLYSTRLPILYPMLINKLEQNYLKDGMKDIKLSDEPSWAGRQRKDENS